jgi:hypothetical protein
LRWSTGALNGDARRYGLPSFVRVWRIPYVEAGRILFERVRLLDEADMQRFDSKYRHPKGQSLRAYDPDGHLERGSLTKLLIAAGEANAASE